MTSYIYRGEVFHSRYLPVEHSFSYPVYFYAFDLDDLAELGRRVPLFGYNQLRPVAIHDRDYLHDDNRPLRRKLTETLKGMNIHEPVGRVILVTSARYFNYVFNPISFFYCYAADSNVLICVLVQVRNTFGEMHLYLVEHSTPGPAEGSIQSTRDKKFHVSPFFSRDGYYRFDLTEPKQRVDNSIRYFQSDQLALVARIHGQGELLTGQALTRTIIRHPFAAILTTPRILWQAAKLFWQRRLPVYTKPAPDHVMTIRTVPSSLIDRVGQGFVFRHLDRLRRGRLELKLPNGDIREFGEPGTSVQHLRVRDNRFFRKVLFAGEIGFGEAYTAGEWTTPDLPGLLTILATNAEIVDDRHLVGAAMGRWINLVRHKLRANTLKGSRRNISEHYDLSNDFFATFLDSSMTYSAALFDHRHPCLASAQANKLRTIIEKANIQRDDHVLEIGCGWGSFAIEAARLTGCRVTGITLSQQQLKLARERVAAAGLEDRIELKLCDYRHITGQYDKIVSIEMLEAVGHSGLNQFFSACDRVLRPGGKAVIQVITIPDAKYTAYRYSSDWIRKYVFPGGHLPSIGAMTMALSTTSLTLKSLEQYGSDYRKTLDFWRQTFIEKRARISALGYDDYFLRTWEYYLAYCQAGFAARIIDLAQLVLDKPESPRQ